MSGIHVRVTAIVDPCGRVLIHEVEKWAPLEKSYSDVPPNWYRNPACRTYTFDVTLPVPILETPQITYRGPEVQDTFCNTPLEAPQEKRP